MMILVFFAILSVIPHGINCNRTDYLTVLSDNQTEIGTLSKSIVLKCSFSVNESSINVIIWYFDGNKIVLPLSAAVNNPDKKRIRGYYNGTLIIENIKYSDAKMYKCEAYGESILFEVNINLIVNGPPLNFGNFTYKAISDSALYFSWEINVTNTNTIRKYNITLCKSNGMKECQEVVLNHPTYEYLFTNLKPFTDYLVTIIAFNDFGANKMSVLKAQTKPGIPLAQLFLMKKNVAERNVTLHIECKDCFDKEKMRGTFKYFVITYKGKYGGFSTHLSTNTTVTEKTFISLHPYTNYTFNVLVSNGIKEGQSLSINFTTKEDLPNSSKFLRTEYVKSNEIGVKWDAADDGYGPITGYVLKILDNNGLNKEEKQFIVNRTVNSFVFKDLKTRNPYIISLASVNNVGKSTFAQTMAKTDRSVPSSPIIKKVDLLKNVIRLSWTNVFPSTELSLLVYDICWTKLIRAHSEYKNNCLEIKSTNKGEIKCSCNRNDSLHSVDIPFNRIDFNDTKIKFWVKVTVQSDLCENQNPCTELTATSDTFAQNIEELPGYANLNPSRNQSATIIIISTIACIIFLAGFFGVFFLCGNKNLKEVFSNRRPHCNYLRPSGEYIEACPREVLQPKIIPLEKTPHPPIEVKDLVDHIMRYRCDDGAGFQAEFEAIEMMDTSRWSITYPNRKDNKVKNRYTNIFPYDHSRVLLQNPVNGKSDYINASFVDGFNRRNAYIATQGPLVDTIGDFWQMVYEQNSEVIVMITNFDERGRRKCEMYWVPNNVVCYGNISVRQIYQKKMAFYTERRFSIKNIRNRKNANKERTVYHYQYTDWRDFDVPPSSLPVLLFVKATTKHWSMSSGPIIIHCSAGVGRTGTYICIESQIRQMEHEYKINVRGFLEHIRQQRMKLVQTESQYTFIHDALYEYYLCPDHDIRKDIFPAYVFKLKCGDCIGFTNQFQMCTQFEPTNYEYIECKRSYNVMKNRSKILPIESRRINLCCEPGIEGSNYINASAIQGYWDMKEFIITQHPFKETEPDFWKMVWDENCTIIILLSNVTLPQFWPADENDLRTYPWSQVNYCSYEENENISKHGFLLSSPREDFNLNCTMHRLKQWPTSVSDTADLLNLLFVINAEKVHAPIVIVDDIGGPRAGIFVAMSTLLNQLRYDDVVDVYFVMKMIHMERPHTFTDSDNLKFIYELLELIIANQHSYPFFSNPSSDCIPNGVCHQNSSAITNTADNSGCFVTQYATLNTLKSKSSSSSATFRRRASSAESEPFCPPSSSPNNRISWNPGQTARYSLMDWSSSSMMMGNGHYNGGLVIGGGGGSGGGGNANSVQIIANPISVSELPVAKIISQNSNGSGGGGGLNLGNNGAFESTTISSSDV